MAKWPKVQIAKGSILEMVKWSKKGRVRGPGVRRYPAAFGGRPGSPNGRGAWLRSTPVWVRLPPGPLVSLLCWIGQRMLPRVPGSERSGARGGARLG